MHLTHKKWLSELDNELEITVSDDVSNDAINNMVTFGLDINLGLESWIEFVTNCGDLYANKSNDLNMWFYAWHDEQVGQIRISAVGSNEPLPFECTLMETTLDQVIGGAFRGESWSNDGELKLWKRAV